MPLSFEFDPSVFRNPLAGDNPCGIDLQTDAAGRGIRSTLRDLREEARRLERRADDGDTSEGGWPEAVAIWRQLRDKSLEVLKAQSRDLSIAALCIEALSRTDGFAGLAAGFDMTRAMAETSWEHLFPIPDPEDGPATPEMIVEERSMPLARLVGLDSEGLLVPAILHVPLTSDRAGDKFGLCHYRSSRDLVSETDSEKIQLAVSRGATSPAQFNQSVQATPLEFLKSNYLDLTAAAGAWEALSKAVSDVSEGKAVVPASPLRALFEECDAAMRVFAPQAIPETAAKTEAADAGQAAAATGGAVENSGSPAGREEAFRQLEKIAAYFERHDPHSLLSAQIRNVVRLGRLPLADYYKELIADGSALQTLFKFVGIDPPPPAGG
jgi:type VI secretion system protein ImpA